MSCPMGLCARGIYGYRDAVRFDPAMAEEIRDLSNLLEVVNSKDGELTFKEIDLVLHVSAEDQCLPEWAVAS